MAHCLLKTQKSNPSGNSGMQKVASLAYYHPSQSTQTEI